MGGWIHRLALYGFHVLIVRPVLHGLVGIRYRHAQRVPEGPCLVVSNHNSHLDAAVLMTLFPLRRLSRVHPVAAADYFGTNWFRRAVALMCMNGLPIDRKAPRGKDPLFPVAERLREGHSLVFFPEGSRGEAGVVAPFRRGVGLLVREIPELQVVPVFLSGPERIWPRGNVVPLPLSIDVNVGAPRSYDSELDAKEIAERVRQDVLALAPPPPPVPGNRPAPPIRVAVACIDPDYRRELVQALVTRLGRGSRALAVSEPVLEADADGVREATGPIAVGRPRPWLRLLSRVFRTRGMFPPQAFVDVVERAQTEEALGHAREFRHVVTDGSALVELIAGQAADAGRDKLDDAVVRRWIRHLSGHSQVPLTKLWWFLRKAPEIGLILGFHLGQPPIPDLLVLARVEPSRRVERVRSGASSRRSFDDLDSLERLDRAYRRVAAVLRQWRGVEVVEVDLEDSVPSALADRIADQCEGLGARSVEAGS